MLTAEPQVLDLHFEVQIIKLEIGAQNPFHLWIMNDKFTKLPK